ncbi:fimbrial protein [Lelliottia sp. JS-SCA-14]|uniref:fimbrial protein n=1 Tax=Lelliottia sp. JS-SCA-14 TaxID=3110110 RepID=UPI002D792D56|nr:fimbrial protein [Lelliottia sp. JS-SCA-14]
MKLLRLFVCTVSLFCTLCINAQATSSASINVSGKVIASPCQISPDDLVKNISLGDEIPAKDAVGTMGERQKFTITLTDCPSGTSSVIATFSGTPASMQPDFAYANSATENAAKNVAVVLQYSDSTGMGNGKTYKVDVTSGVNPVFYLQTNAYSLGNATPGDISASIVMSFEYN